MHATSIARICHDADRSLCAAHGDLSMPGWFALTDDQRANAQLGVAIAAATPGASASDLHVAWLHDKRAQGWKYGAKLDVEARKDPLLRPWSQLGRFTRTREALFVAVVRALTDEANPKGFDEIAASFHRPEQETLQ